MKYGVKTLTGTGGDEESNTHLVIFSKAKLIPKIMFIVMRSREPRPDALR